MAELMKRVMAFLISGVIFLAAAVGIYLTLQSPLFIIQVVEVNDQSTDSPLDTQAVLRLAAIPVGKINLFDLDLALVEQRILTESWVDEVVIQKKFPQTVSIGVTYRKPRAVVQGERGRLSYVDDEGVLFGNVDLAIQPDFPILSGFTGDNALRLMDAVYLMAAWQESSVSKVAELSSLTWDNERGFRALLTYAVGLRRSRTMVDLGQESEGELQNQLRRLARVVSYLSKNSVAARQIWIDAGKKIVVKSAKGS